MGAGKKQASSKTKSAVAKADRPIYGTSLGRKELEPYLPKSGPLFAYVFSCTFASTDDLATLQTRLERGLAKIPEATKVGSYAANDPSHATVSVEFPKKQWGLGVQRDGEGRYRLQITFREKGQAWGSNYALWHLLKEATLPLLGAKNVVEDPHDHAQRVWG